VARLPNTCTDPALLRPRQAVDLRRQSSRNHQGMMPTGFATQCRKWGLAFRLFRSVFPHPKCQTAGLDSIDFDDDIAQFDHRLIHRKGEALAACRSL